MAQFANIRIELDKMARLADVKHLKAEVNRLAQELKKRGETEVAHVEKTVKQVRSRVMKLRNQVESEVTKLRGLVKKATKKSATKTKPRKTSAKKAKSPARKKAARKAK
ncbi:MAG: hypothetical protein JNJ49_08700 [Bdellovibrionaceae bacterium]|nr:hypothetical protein [Pseudobdellovibrionaceae bacterium]